MKVFSCLYNKTLQWSQKRHAPFYLASVAFAESSFFPIPPDVMLISMGLAIPKKSWYFAAITTLFSVLGGIFGYIIGHFFMSSIQPFLASTSYGTDVALIEEWFKEYGTIIVFVAAFSPFPYKLFTIAAGSVAAPFLPFVIGSLLGRGTRFFLVSAFMYFSGDNIKVHLSRYIEWIGWLFLILVLVIVLIKWL